MCSLLKARLWYSVKPAATCVSWRHVWDGSKRKRRRCTYSPISRVRQSRNEQKGSTKSNTIFVRKLHDPYVEQLHRRDAKRMRSACPIRKLSSDACGLPKNRSSMRGSQQGVVRAVLLLSLLASSVAETSSNQQRFAAAHLQADEQPAHSHEFGRGLTVTGGREQLANSAFQPDLNLVVSLKQLTSPVCVFAVASAQHTHADLSFIPQHAMVKLVISYLNTMHCCVNTAAYNKSWM